MSKKRKRERKEKLSNRTKPIILTEITSNVEDTRRHGEPPKRFIPIFLKVVLKNGEEGYIYNRSLAILRAWSKYGGSYETTDKYSEEITFGLKNNDLLKEYALNCDPEILLDYLVKRVHNGTSCRY